MMRITRYSAVILLLAVLLLVACSPLRRTQRNQRTESTAVDKTEIRKAVHDILRESGTFTQTVVEFYPPTVAPPESSGERHRRSVAELNKDALSPALPEGKSQADGSGGIGAAFPPKGNLDALPAAEQSRPRPPAVKRIVRTEIVAQREREITSDSTAQNDIRTNTHTELSEKVVEKPPAATSNVRWIAIALAAVAVTILLLKLPKIRLPRI